MKKNLLLLFNCTFYLELKHTFRIMKITTMLILIAVFQISATTLHSQNAKVNISRSTLPLQEFIREIEKQTDYLFMYSEKEIDMQQQVHVNAKDKPVSEVLKEALANSQIKYNFNEGYISLRKVKSEIVNQTDRKITGLVKDTNGEPVIGANIMVKGSSIGTITDIDGRFTLEIPDNTTLLISYIGYLPQEIATANKSDFSILLKEDTQTLEEVVVVGYGQQKKVSITGAVGNIKSDNINRLANSTTASMQGVAPGLTILDKGGSPGRATTTLRIRGITTINTQQNENDNIDRNAALLLVDGVEQRISDINPDDIESISILKDASTTAIYGSRAANGVVLVTTKRGKKGKIRMNFNTYWGVQSVTNKPEHMETVTYMKQQNYAFQNAGQAPR